jgi:hypothetical protein
MKKADHTNFVSVLSEAKPVLIYFHHKADAAQTQKIKAILKSVEKELPLLPLYDYTVDATDENQLLADFIEVTETPVFIFYKNGNFHRYKDKIFTKKSISQFIGNKNLYTEKEVKKLDDSPNETL